MLRGQKQSGFTIVELLIVIVVIGILAAITIVSFNGVQNRAADTVVQSDLNALIKKAGIFYAENARHYTASSEIQGFTASKSGYSTAPTTTFNLTSCYVTTGAVFGAVALSKSGKIFYANTIDNTVKLYTAGTWFTNSGSACTAILDGVTSINNYNGYSSTDTSSGPWRSWVGGN